MRRGGCLASKSFHSSKGGGRKQEEGEEMMDSGVENGWLTSTEAIRGIGVSFS
jgi:hypothetical protein